MSDDSNKRRAKGGSGKRARPVKKAKSGKPSAADRCLAKLVNLLKELARSTPEVGVLALSGAMPGLVGATMRRGGYYARMREGITHEETGKADGGGEQGFVVVKLFNRPLADLTETLAARPLLAPADALDGLEPEAAEGDWVRLAVTLA